MSGGTTHIVELYDELYKVLFKTDVIVEAEKTEDIKAVEQFYEMAEKAVTQEHIASIRANLQPPTCPERFVPNIEPGRGMKIDIALPGTGCMGVASAGLLYLLRKLGEGSLENNGRDDPIIEVDRMVGSSSGASSSFFFIASTLDIFGPNRVKSKEPTEQAAKYFAKMKHLMIVVYVLYARCQSRGMGWFFNTSYQIFGQSQFWEQCYFYLLKTMEGHELLWEAVKSRLYISMLKSPIARLSGSYSFHPYYVMHDFVTPDQLVCALVATGEASAKGLFGIGVPDLPKVRIGSQWSWMNAENDNGPTTTTPPKAHLRLPKSYYDGGRPPVWVPGTHNPYLFLNPLMITPLTHVFTMTLESISILTKDCLQSCITALTSRSLNLPSPKTSQEKYKLGDIWMAFFSKDQKRDMFIQGKEYDEKMIQEITTKSDGFYPTTEASFCSLTSATIVNLELAPSTPIVQPSPLPPAPDEYVNPPTASSNVDSASGQQLDSEDGSISMEPVSLSQDEQANVYVTLPHRQQMPTVTRM